MPAPPPLISVIIPTYNRAGLVCRAVDSALAQTYGPLEILVVDDGSTDDTAERLRPYGDRVRYLKKDNGGVSAARNLGLSQAQGDFIGFLDSDDVWVPDKLARQMQVFASQPDCGLVLSDVVQVGPGGRVLSRSHRRATIPVDGRVLKYVLSDPILPPSCTLVKKSVLLEVGGFDEGLRTAEDQDLHLRVALRYPEALVAEPLVHMMNDAAVQLGEEPRSYRDAVHVVERFLSRHGDEIQQADLDLALVRLYLGNARGVLRQRERRLALRWLGQGLLHARGQRALKQAAPLLYKLAWTWFTVETKSLRQRFT